MTGEQDGTTISGGTFNIRGHATFGEKSHINVNQSDIPDQHAEEKEALKVLLAFAGPADLKRLSLGEEDSTIREAWRLGWERDTIEIKSLHATNTNDLRRALLDGADIVHIAGHGTPEGAMLHDRGGLSRIIPLEAMESLFEDRDDQIRCVVLNYCYSLLQGHLLVRHVPYVVVIEGTLYDNTALEFSRGFYDAICAGKDITHAYTEGCRAVRSNYLRVPFISQLLQNVSFG